MHKTITQIPLWRKKLSVATIWCLLLIALYTGLFVSRVGMLIPAGFAQVVYLYEKKKYNLYMIPKQLIERIHSTRFYDKFFRIAPANKTWRCVRNLTLGMVVASGIIHLVSLSDGPILDLDDMSVVQGTIEDCKRLARRNHCGSHILTIRKEDGGVEIFYESTLSRRDLQIGKEVTIWTQPHSFFADPACKKYNNIWQTKGNFFSDSYDKGQREIIVRLMNIVSNTFFAMGMILLACLVSYPPDNPTDD